MYLSIMVQFVLAFECGSWHNIVMMVVLCYGSVFN